MAKRMKKKNGAELLLMGANPHAKRKLNNPLINANFSTGEKMALGRLGIPWTSIQTDADARRARAALRKSEAAKNSFFRGAKRNPMSGTEERKAATEIYTGFHAQAPGESLVLNEPHIPEGTYPELGLLVNVKFRPTNRNAETRYVRAFVVPQENVHVIGDLERDQIYFAGGNQYFSHEEMRKLGWDGSQNQFEVGEAIEITYIARKYHEEVQASARGEIVEWVHEFGEESGELPTFWYDVAVKRIYLRGGAYKITDRGIVN